MQLELGTTAHGFAIDRREDLPEIDGEAYVGTHVASGARLLYLKNDDNNKSFSIGFRTPPKDDTGVFHILEHSVLCGSQRFPVKEPFVDLLKSSMQTFLNAMTFADKTLYPVASTNEQDLFNLMDVYLDAVFHPNIYVKRAIFEQEGWHYELRANGDASENPADLDAADTSLSYNGVVFNEMKGALSDANSVLYDNLQAALFPDTCYAFESGGTPEAIPTLTYEEYLDEHRRHYRTDNSYIILYGNLDIDRALAFLDERYLTPLCDEQAQADAKRAAQGLDLLRPRTIATQKPVDAGYASQTMDTAPENACAACGYVIGDASDRVRSMATEILLDALFGSNEAPLKRALLDAGVAHDVQAFVSDALLQPFAVVQVNMPEDGAGEKLHGLIAAEARKLVDAGLDKSLVEASLSHTEFQMREHDMGYADGVIDAMLSLSSWLYDDDAPIDYLRYELAFAQLREALAGDYFEQLCISLFCENNHTASVEIVPAPGHSDDRMAAELQAANVALTAAERHRIVEEEARLRALQEAPDAPEAVAMLPRLSVSDIDAAPAQPAYGYADGTPIPCVRHDVPTRGIAYAYRYFDLQHIAFEDLPYLSILSQVLGKLDTARHTAMEIDTLVQGKLGNLTFFTKVYENETDPTFALPKLTVSSSALSENVEWLADLPLEIMTETNFGDTARIHDVLKQYKIGLEQHFLNAGHSCATARLKSYYAPAGQIAEQLSNVGFYQFLCDLLDHFDERAAQLSERLDAIARAVFCDDICTISFAGSDEDFDAYWKASPLCGRTNDSPHALVVPEPTVRNEAFVVPSDVCYAALGWDRRRLGTPYSGSWAVVGRALSYDYLWNEVRVKGGAYGVGFQGRLSGNMRFYSYRDPHLDETIARFAQSCDWVAAYDPARDEFEGFIVATVAGIDAPVKPRALIARQIADLFADRDPHARDVVRQQIIDTTVDDVRSLAGPLKRAVDAHALCVFGNRDIIESSKQDLDVITLVG